MEPGHRLGRPGQIRSLNTPHVETATGGRLLFSLPSVGALRPERVLNASGWRSVPSCFGATDAPPSQM